MFHPQPPSFPFCPALCLSLFLVSLPLNSCSYYLPYLPVKEVTLAGLFSVTRQPANKLDSPLPYLRQAPTRP